LKHGDDLSPFIFNLDLEYAIRTVQVIQVHLKLKGTLQFLVYVDDDNILGGSLRTTKGNAESLVMASKENGLVVNADKTKYMAL